MAKLNRLHDRCDSCRAQAFVRVENKAGHDLVLCSHHYRKFEADLFLQGFKPTEDERGEVNLKPSISANAE